MKVHSNIRFHSLVILSLILFDFSIRLFRERWDRIKRGEEAFIAQIAFRSRKKHPNELDRAKIKSDASSKGSTRRGVVSEVNFSACIPDSIPRYIEIQRQHAVDEATKSTRREWGRRDIQRRWGELKTRRSAWIDISTRAIFFPSYK